METSYKEKYEQALAKAKEQYNYPCMRSCMGILEEIFPELAESEDEKVRKALIDFFGKGAKYGGQTNGVYDKDILAWLEKQKGNICGISPNSAWSEEDSFRTETLISVIKSGCSIRPELRNEFVNWLKSFRPQNRWNPNDEQIKVCKEVYADILSAKGFDLGTVVSELNRMEEELKKLKE